MPPFHCIEGEAEVVAAALREWDRQHEWLHSPEERAADRRDAEQELARVVAALRVWHAAAIAAATSSSSAAAAPATTAAAATTEAEEAAATTEAEEAAATAAKQKQ